MSWTFWATTVALVCGLLAGHSIEVLHVDLGIEYDGQSLRIAVDPVFLVGGGTLLSWPYPGADSAISNVVFISAPRERTPGSVTLEHELAHVYQFRALGPFLYPIFWFGLLPIEGCAELYAAGDLAGVNATMWIPPRAWPLTFSFLVYVVGSYPTGESTRLRGLTLERSRLW